MSVYRELAELNEAAEMLPIMREARDRAVDALHDSERNRECVEARLAIALEDLARVTHQRDTAVALLKLALRSGVFGDRPACEGESKACPARGDDGACVAGNPEDATLCRFCGGEV